MIYRLLERYLPSVVFEFIFGPQKQWKEEYNTVIQELTTHIKQCNTIECKECYVDHAGNTNLCYSCGIRQSWNPIFKGKTKSYSYHKYILDRFRLQRLQKRNRDAQERYSKNFLESFKNN